MSDKNKVVAIIPARSGSKGLVRKNIAMLAGKPLIAWTIEAAKKSSLVGRIIVSTDDIEIAEIAKKYGAEVPFIRPREISGDLNSSEEVLVHAVDWIAKNEKRFYDIVLYLQITDPFRNRDIINQVIRKLMDNPELDSVFAAKPTHKNYWYVDAGKPKKILKHNYLPRQMKSPVYREDTGVALASRISVIRSGRRIGKNVHIIAHVNKADFVDIHSSFDLWLAETIIKERGIVPNE
jgi:CMP-N,N'-diacetyllegionaminic acid synthase